MMRVFRATILLSLAATFAASSGCARWTLFPKSAAPIPSPGEKPRVGLLEAAGLRQASDQQEANSGDRDQQVVNDLTHLDPALAMARLAERQGTPSEARRQYQAFMKKNPRHPLPHHRLGVMAAREAKYDQAEAHFQMATRLAPPTAELLSDIGYLYYLQDRLGEAEHMLRQATQMEPSHHGANNNLGLVLAAKGNYDRSLRQFRRVNGEAEARANLAYMHSQRGNYDQSRQEYLRALTLDNTLTNAAEALLQVEEARKREEQALAKIAQVAGDKLLAPTAEPNRESPQQIAHAEVGRQPMSQQEQARATQPQTQPVAMPQPPAADYVVAALPQSENVPAKQSAVETNRFAQQSQLLMPIPAPPETSEAAAIQVPAQHYPSTSVQPASHVEGASRFTEPTHAAPSVGAASVAPPVETQRQSAEVHTTENNWNDAWRQLSGGSTANNPRKEEELSDQPQATMGSNATPSEPQKSGGIRISIGG